VNEKLEENARIRKESEAQEQKEQQLNTDEMKETDF
jgi:hypothetical protein